MLKDTVERNDEKSFKFNLFDVASQQHTGAQFTQQNQSFTSPPFDGNENRGTEE